MNFTPYNSSQTPILSTLFTPIISILIPLNTFILHSMTYFPLRIFCPVTFLVSSPQNKKVSLALSTSQFIHPQFLLTFATNSFYSSFLLFQMQILLSFTLFLSLIYLFNCAPIEAENPVKNDVIEKKIDSVHHEDAKGVEKQRYFIFHLSKSSLVSSCEITIFPLTRFWSLF